MEIARQDRARPEAAEDLYARDFYSWAQRQAELLRCGLFEQLDIGNIIEERLGARQRVAAA